jgi:L-iditol 2-dehydrogenase
MKAAVVLRPNVISIEEIPTPEPGPDDIVIRVHACGVCGSDVHCFEGHHFLATFPRVLGHEFSGVVADLGRNVTSLKPGDRVCAETNIPCGRCHLCTSGHSRLCKEKLVLGFNANGGYAEYARLPAVNAVRVPGHVTLEHAAVAQPMGVCLHALRDRGDIKEGLTVAVFGAGPVGLGGVAVAKVYGCRAIAIDTDPNRLAVAGKLGADLTVNPAEEDVVERVMEFTGGRGADRVVEAVGGNQDTTLQQAVKIAGRTGIVLIVGTFAANLAAIPINDVRAGEIDVRGSHGQYMTYGDCIDLVASGKVNLMPTLSHEIGLDEAERGLRMMKTREDNAVKVLLKP